MRAVFCLIAVSFALSFAALMAIFTSTPDGTQYRTGASQEWQTAHVNDQLFSEYESRNRLGSNYSVSVYDSVQVDFPDGATSLLAGKYSGGTAEYKNTQGTWVTMPQNQTVTGTSVRTGTGCTLPLTITGGRGVFKPRDWGGDSQ